jgi:hypothetical protein
VAVTRRKSSSSGAVLPRATSRAGSKAIGSVDQILTPKQRNKLRNDLSEMARQRREAEVSSGSMRLN